MGDSQVARLPVGIAPRLLQPDQAAAYCGVGVDLLEHWVEAGRIHTPINWGRGSKRESHRYDRRRLDADLDRLYGVGVGGAENAEEARILEQMGRTRRARAATVR